LLYNRNSRRKLNLEINVTQDEFLKEMDDMLELEAGTLRGPEKLEDLDQWTSLAVVTFMALADTNNGVHVSPLDIGKCITVSDLLKLAKVEPES
jgi:acyl carrier protein